MKFRILQIQEYQWVVEGKFWWFWPNNYGYFDSLHSAELHLFWLMKNAEKKKFVKRVVGDPGEYELRYLKQRIEEITK